MFNELNEQGIKRSNKKKQEVLDKIFAQHKYNTLQEGVLKKYVRTIQRYGDRTCQAMYGARDNN